MHTTIPLSSAIRLGSMLGPQLFGAWEKETLQPRFIAMLDGRYEVCCDLVIAACALGGAARAVGRHRHEVNELWPWATEHETLCPACGQFMTAFAVVMHLNDFHRWSRELIADYVVVLESVFEDRREREATGELVAVHG